MCYRTYQGFILRPRSGITLTEVLIVTMVISILLGLIIPRFKGVQDDSNIAQAKAELRTLQTAVESYYANQTPNAYPATTTTLCATSINGATPIVVGEVLSDPFQPSGEYEYILSSNGEYFVVFSAGVDRAIDITGINDSGVLQGVNDDDIYATNGSGF
jgi:type II secretory pathway pseudopilin PulG